MEDKSKYYKSLFITYFDGCDGITPEPNVPSTYQMGVCKLEYVEMKNKLIIHLRRPGLLIGKGGKTIDTFSKWICASIEIVEVNLFE